MKYPASKWLKYKVLVENEEIAPYLPETMTLDQDTFFEMFDKYDLLYVKPSIGGGGKGVFRVERTEKWYIFQTRKKKMRFRKLHSVWVYLQKLIPPQKRYLVQQGLNLMHIDERPVDFRVILVKPRRNSEWEYKGIIGKCAAKDSHITNRCSGGTSIRFHEALQQGLEYDEVQCEEAAEMLKTLSLNIAETMNEYFVNINQLGLDIGIDQDEQFWLIEANTRPNFQLFRHHEEPKMFAHIRAEIRKLREPNKKKA